MSIPATLLRGIQLCLVCSLAACASGVHIHPSLDLSDDNHNNPIKIASSIHYSGNHDYLPRSLHASGSVSSNINIRYRYEVKYGSEDLFELAIFNPFTLFGFPSGKEDVTVVGELTVERSKEILKTYRAVCHIRKHQNLWVTQTATKMRRQGLIAVRDNIDGQLLLDKPFLEQLNIVQ